jgi:hypothetical protein
MTKSQTPECSVLNFEKLRIEIYLSFEFCYLEFTFPPIVQYNINILLL